MRWRLLFILAAMAAGPLSANAADDVVDSDADAPPATEPVFEPIPRPAILSRSQLIEQRLQADYGEQYLSLSTTTEAFSGLFLPANRPVAKGLVILVPGLYENADSAANIAALRQLLPDSGWHTLSLNLPDPSFTALSIEGAAMPLQPLPDDKPDAPPPTTDDASAAPVEDDAEAEIDEILDEPLPPDDMPIVMDDPLAEPVFSDLPEAESVDEWRIDELNTPEYAKRMNAMLAAAIDHGAYTLNAATIVLVAQHEGAYWALSVLSQQRDNGKVSAVLLVHPRQPEQSEHRLAQLSGKLQIPIVDYFSGNQRWARDAAQERRNASRRLAGSQYQQVALHARNQTLQAAELERRVKGWLSQFKPPK